jgi:hypothetical protein
VRSAIQDNGLPQYILPPTKTPLPCRITQNHNALRGRLIFAGMKITTQRWGNSQQPEKAIAYNRATRILGARWSIK